MRAFVYLTGQVVDGDLPPSFDETKFYIDKNRRIKWNEGVEQGGYPFDGEGVDLTN